MIQFVSRYQSWLQLQVNFSRLRSSRLRLTSTLNPKLQLRKLFRAREAKRGSEAVLDWTLLLRRAETSAALRPRQPHPCAPAAVMGQMLAQSLHPDPLAVMQMLAPPQNEVCF